MKKIASSLFLALTVLLAPSYAYASSGGGEESMVTGLLVIIGSCLALTGLAYKFGFPPILGQLAAGIIVGNLANSLHVHSVQEALGSEFLALFGGLGIVVLMFESGLEGNLDSIKKQGASAVLVAVLGVLIVGVLGYGVAKLLLPADTHWLGHVFVACALTPTSASIGAAIFGAKKLSSSPEGGTTLVAAVVDDILGLVILAVMVALGESVTKGQAVAVGPLALTFVKALAFLVGGVVIGRWLAPRYFKGAARLTHPEMLLPTAIVIMLAFSLLALKVAGLAALIGAYVAGLILEKAHYQDLTDPSHGEHELENAVKPLRMLMAPVFFFLLGSKVPVAALVNPTVLMMAGALTVACLVGKIGSGLGVLEKDTRKSAVVFGMMPRGEVAAIMVSAGSKIIINGKPLISEEIFTAFVVMILLTTLIAIFGLNKVLADMLKSNKAAPPPVTSEETVH